MAITKFTEDMDIIASLGNRPNIDNGLSADQLKAKFDLAGKKIQDYINNTLVDEIIANVGAPLMAATAAAMMDEDRIYVYTGSETGYTSGNWYYYNGSAWVSGGVYNSTAFETVAPSATETPGKAADAKATGEALDEKANVDGYYDEMAVGSAEQLLSSIKIPDKVPYNFRTSGGSVDIGTREEQHAIVGGTLAFNQLAPALNTTNWAGSSGQTTTFADGVVTVHKDEAAGALASVGVKTTPAAKIIQGHKYFVSMIAQTTNGKLNLLYDGTAGHGVLTATYLEYASKTLVSNIWEAPEASNGNNLTLTLRGYTGAANISSALDFTVEKVQAFDLTQMFGSTIADYVYSLETANAGDGVAWVKRLFPADFYTHDAGTLMSVKTSAHKMIGFNAYDHTAGTAKVVGGNVYQITGTYTALSLNGESITPDASGYFTPTKNGTLTVTGGNSTDTCVHLKWDGERDGDWEEYKEWTYALDSDLELRGMPKLDANNSLYYDGDTYAPDGTVTRKRHKVTIDGVNVKAILVRESNGVYYTTFALGVLGVDTSNSIKSIINDQNYEEIRSVVAGNIYIAGTGSTLAICLFDQTLTTASAVDTYFASHPLTIEYDRATPTTETADPYSELQNVDDWGTEEFIDTRTVPIPVGHETDYQANLRAKLEMAPNSPSDGDGDYIVRQTSGVNEYVKLITPSDIPAAPTTDGTYILKCTVADGEAEYEWEAQS